MDQALALFAYPEHRRRGHDQDNFLSIAKIKPPSCLNDQQNFLNILPVTVKIVRGVNEPSISYKTIYRVRKSSHISLLLQLFFWQQLLLTILNICQSMQKW